MATDYRCVCIKHIRHASNCVICLRHIDAKATRYNGRRCIYRTHIVEFTSNDCFSASKSKAGRSNVNVPNRAQVDVILKYSNRKTQREINALSIRPVFTSGPPASVENVSQSVNKSFDLSRRKHIYRRKRVPNPFEQMVRIEIGADFCCNISLNPK